MKLNGKEMNNKNIIIGILATVVGGLLILTLTLVFNRSGEALSQSREAYNLAVANRQNIAVIMSRLEGIETRLEEIKGLIKK